MKTFKQLREATSYGKPVFKAVGKKSDVTTPNNDEAASLEPRPADEKTFKAMQSVNTVKDEEEQEKLFQGKTKAAIQPTNGERIKVKQGSSDVGMKSQNMTGGMKQTPAGRENPKGSVGDVKPVVVSPSAVKPMPPATPRASLKTFRESLHNTSVDEATLNNPALGALINKARAIRPNPVWVDRSEHSWGKILTVKHMDPKMPGSISHSYPLHPEHQSKIRDLRDGQTTTFRDETGKTVTATRDDQNVVFTSPRHSIKSTVPYYHFSGL